MKETSIPPKTVTTNTKKNNIQILKRRIRIIIVIIFIAQVVSTIFAIAGVFISTIEAGKVFKYSIRAEADFLRHESVITKYYSSPSGGTIIVHCSEGYFVSDSLDGQLNMKIIEQYVASDEFENYLAEKDSLIPVWRIPNTQGCSYRREKDGERFALIKILKPIRFGLLMISPFFVLLYLNRFLNKKLKQYA